MNYTVVVCGGTILFSLAYYYFPKYGGRYWFRGPVTTVTMEDGNGTSSSSDKKGGSRTSSDGSVHGSGAVLKGYVAEKVGEVAVG